MKQKLFSVRRALYAILALALPATFLIPTFVGEAFAYGQVTSRAIKMSDARPGDQGGTSVSYSITFTPAAATTIKAFAIDFCSSDPLPGDACTQPTGFTVGGSPTGTTTVTGETATWAYSSVNSGRTLEVQDTSASGTPTAVSIVVNTVTNPSAPAAEFWGRMFTFASTANLTTWNSTADGSATATVLDAGGAAMSTTSAISITAKVMETLVFCVSGASITGTCGGLTTPSLTLGHGSTTLALDNTQRDTAPAYTQLSTNATSGAQVRMKDVVSGATCGGLSKDNSSTCPIPAIGATAATIANAAADFGMCVIPGTNSTADTPYDDPGGSGGTLCATTTPSNSGVKYGMDQTTSGNNVLSTYGSNIFHTTGPVSNEANTCDFVAQASNTTPAGIYTVNESLIATGTF